MLAQISVAMNRVYTEYYPASGKDFDITSSTAYDQSFVYNRDIYENISELVDEIFDSYIRKDGNVEPLFATFCDGDKVQCNGLSQWGSVYLAGQGRSALEILRYYYGDDIEIVSNVPISGSERSAPAVPLLEGDTGRDVEYIQLRLNRISANYPAIPKIPVTDGFFGPETLAAVREFQRVFGLTDDGIVGNATWYKIQFIYNAVKRLNEVSSEGLAVNELPSSYPGELAIGDSGSAVRILQYYLEYISLFVPTVSAPAVDGIFGTETERAVRSFERTYGLSESGTVDRALWNKIQATYYNALRGIDYSFYEGRILPFPGRVLLRGSEGEDVRVLQEYLSVISDYIPDIPRTAVDGSFGDETERAVIAFNRRYGIGTNEARVTAETWDTLTEIYEDIFYGRAVNEGQFPGYTVG